MSDPATDVGPLRARYVDDLSGLLRPTDPLVVEAFRAVDRADFLTGFYRRSRDGWLWTSTDVRPLPDAVAAAVYGNQALVTQLGPDGLPASSSSMPGLMMAMLDRLGVRPGMRVLEIGTGTGYNAALLGHLVGPDGRVTTVEADPGLAALAARRLADAGMGDHVEVVPGDGAAGHPASAPYDRIIATAGCTTVPMAWWHQLAADGRALVPHARGAMFPLALLGRGDGPGRWTGRYVGHANFMAAVGATLGGDGHRVAVVRLPGGTPVAEEDSGCTPREAEDAAFFVALELPDARAVRLVGGDVGRRMVGGLGLVTGSGAAVLAGTALRAGGEGSAEAAQRIRAALDRWRACGSPGITRYALDLAPVEASPPSGPDRPAASATWHGIRGATADVVTLLDPDDTAAI